MFGRYGFGYPSTGQGNDLLAFQNRVIADGGEMILNAGEIASLLPLGDWSWFYVPSGRKAGTSYAEIPQNGGGDLTMARASVAEAINRQSAFVSVPANVGRLDFLDGSFLGQPIEPLATNGYWPSSFSADYSLMNMTRSGNIITETVTIGGHGFDGPSRAITVNELRAYGFVFKQLSGTTRRVRMRVSNNVDGNIIGGTFDAVSGQRFSAVSRTGSWSLTGLSDGIINLGNGYWLIYCVGQTPVGSTNLIDLRLDNGTGSFSYAGSTGVSFECFGFQMELGSFPTSRITTTSGSATRQADQFFRASVSNLVGGSPLTMYAEINSRLTAGSAAKRILTISDGTANNLIALEKTSTDTIRALVVTGGVEQMSVISGSSPTGNIRVAAGIAANDGVLYLNGAQIGTDSSITMPTGLNRIDLGQSSVSTLRLNDRVRAAGISLSRWSNDELANLTRI